MVHPFSYSSYKVNDLFEEVSRAAQVAQGNLQKQVEQVSRAAQVGNIQNLSEQVSKTVQAFGQLGFEQNKALQATRAATVKSIEQFSKPVLKDLEQSRLEELCKRFQTPELRGLRDGLGLKRLEIQFRLLEEGLQPTRSLPKIQLTPRLRSEPEPLKKSLSSKPRLNSTNPIASSQAPSLPQQAVSQESQTVQKKSTFRANATLQRSVLIAIYKHLQGSQEQFIKWQPSNWFGKGVISRSDRVNWNNALNALSKKGLVQLCSPNARKSTHNRGNAGTFISLTLEGYQQAKWLIQND